MNKHIKYAMKLKWDEVAEIIGDIISSHLGRKVICTAKKEDYNFWCASAEGEDTFTVEELNSLLDLINADNIKRYDCLPTDSDTSKSLSMDLSETLLATQLGTFWEHASICREGLWIVGINDISMLSRYIAKRGESDET